MDTSQDTWNAIADMVADGVPYWFRETGSPENLISGELMVDTGVAPLQKIRNVYVFDYKNGVVTGVRMVQF